MRNYLHFTSLGAMFVVDELCKTLSREAVKRLLHPNISPPSLVAMETKQTVQSPWQQTFN